MIFYDKRLNKILEFDFSIYYGYFKDVLNIHYTNGKGTKHLEFIGFIK